MSSTKAKARGRRKRHLVAKGIVLLLLVGMIAGYLFLLTTAQNRYTIIDGESVTTVSSPDTDIDQVLAQAGVAVGPEDRITATDEGQTTEILIERRNSVTVELAGEPIEAATYETTVGGLLQELNISLHEQDAMVSEGRSLSPQESIYDGMEIQITQNDTKTVTKTDRIPYETVTFQDPTLAAGEEQVQTPGVAGRRETVYMEKYVNGELTESAVLSTKVLSAPVTEVILVGSSYVSEEEEISLELREEESETESEASQPGEDTPEPEETVEPVQELKAQSEPTPSAKPEPVYEAPAPVYEEPEPVYEAPTHVEPTYQEPVHEETQPSYNTITTASGEVISYSQVLSMEATAYTGGGTTATGTSARYGAIAVDPKVIPYGTRMYIVTDDGTWVYGYATAEDSGGAIKGNIIDLYFDDYSTCIQFGRRSCTVYILD